MTKFIKTIDTLLAKAKQKGFAKINGRYNDGYGAGELEEKYSIKIEDNILTMKHWGTVTAQINLHDNTLEYYYGQSVSDRDSLNTLIESLYIEGIFRYFPSKDLFIYELD